MTSVHIDMRDPVTSAAGADIVLTFTPTRRLAGVGVVPPKRVKLVDGQGGVDLLATDDVAYGTEPWAYRVGEFVGGRDGVYRFVQVPTATGTIEYDALTELVADPSNGVPDAAWWQRMDELENDVLNGALKGDDGDTGPPGSPGISAYQLAVLGGFVGTESQWLTSLHGAPGSSGSPGSAGVGVPAGGTTGQVLAKTSGTDYDTSWATLGSTPLTLTYGASIATNAALGNHFRVTLAGNPTLANPTGLVDGQRYIWEFIQDATGGRTLTLGSAFGLGADITAITLSTGAGKRDFMGATYNAAAAKLFVIAFVKGY